MWQLMKTEGNISIYVAWTREWVGCPQYRFWVTGLEIWQIVMFYIALNFKELFISPQPGVWLWYIYGFGSKRSIFNDHVIDIQKSKLNNVNMWPIVSHIWNKSQNGCPILLTLFTRMAVKRNFTLVYFLTHYIPWTETFS